MTPLSIYSFCNQQNLMRKGFLFSMMTNLMTKQGMGSGEKSLKKGREWTV